MLTIGRQSDIMTKNHPLRISELQKTEVGGNSGESRVRVPKVQDLSIESLRQKDRVHF